MPELDKLRVIDKAFAESRLSWSRVRRLCEVATPRARCHSLVHGGFLLVEVAQCATPATPFPSCDTRGLAAIHGSSLTAWTRPAPS
ncbi:MAG: hypothetical protein HZB39_13430 [Planctomycetes bacterium]|nr:hypothetical protein [Planctomycetota bacterium]